MTSEQDQQSPARVKRPTNNNQVDVGSSSQHSKSTEAKTNRFFQAQGVIGTGSEGVIYQATTTKKYRGTEKDYVAIKAVRRQALSKKEKNFLLREIAVHRAVQHPHICQFYNFFEDREHFYIVLEYLHGGDLLTALRRTKNGFDERTSMAISLQVLDALNYLHERGIAHRDIKPENIMLTNDVFCHNRKEIEVKLIDFGLCCYRELSVAEKFRLSVENVGTTRYAAPEIMNDQSYLPEQADVWSMGITLYTLIGRTNPYLGETNQQVLENVKKNPPLFNDSKWDIVNSRTKNLISKMLSINPDDRPTAKEAFDEAMSIMTELKWIDENENELVPEQNSEQDGLLPPRKRERSIAEKLFNLAESTEADEEIQKETGPEGIFGRIKDIIMGFTNGNDSSEEQEEAQ